MHFKHLLEMGKSMISKDHPASIGQLGFIKQNNVHDRLESGHPEIIVICSGDLTLNPITRAQAGNIRQMNDTVNFRGIGNASAYYGSPSTSSIRTCTACPLFAACRY